MGFKTPSGVEIPRLKIYDTEGEVLEVLTGPMAMDELNKRALAKNISIVNDHAYLQKLIKDELSILTSFCKLNGIILKKNTK